MPYALCLHKSAIRIPKSEIEKCPMLYASTNPHSAFRNPKSKVALHLSRLSRFSIPFIVHRLPFTVHSLPFTPYRLPFTVYHLRLQRFIGRYALCALRYALCDNLLARPRTQYPVLLCTVLYLVDLGD